MIDAAPASTTPTEVGEAAVRVLPRLTRYLIAEMRAIPQARDLTWPQFRVLCYLSERDYRASDLAATLEIGRSTLTAVGDGLVRRRLVERLRDLPGDRRGVLMRLTPAGQALHRLLQAAAVDGVAKLLSTSTDAERNGLGRGLDMVERGLHVAAAAAVAERPVAEGA
jgi:DNA-binding MarR family transcriptional regulator